MPHCCNNGVNDTLSLSTVTASVAVGADAVTGNCSELSKVMFLEHINLHITPAINVVLAIGGLVVSFWY